MDVNSTFEKTGIKCKVLQEIIQLAKKNCVEKVILFGSRARGDYKERSDIDLAFCGGSSSHFILKHEDNLLRQQNPMPHLSLMLFRIWHVSKKPSLYNSHFEMPYPVEHHIHLLK
jgi:hypothetical protein